MTRPTRVRAPAFAALLTAALVACGRGAGPSSPALSAQAGAQTDFVMRHGSTLMMRGHPFRFLGTNNYYLAYQPPEMADDVLRTAAERHFSVVRTWGFLDVAGPSGSGGDGPKNGVFFQSFATTPPTVNEGPTGLQRLDYVVAQAGRLGLKLALPLTNNWGDFGGMDAYVRARGLAHHDAFYTDPTIRAWFKAYVGAVLNHVNVYTGVAYKDDPTIMLWELANEPRCGGSTLPASANCTTDTITSWADDLSSFIRTHDRKHLIGTGDEGFLCDRASSDYMYNCGAGVDGAALAALKNIDVVSLHLYPDAWGKTPAWGERWIGDHLALARASKKAFFLGEFGLLNKDTRDEVYTTWTDAVRRGGGSGSLFWILSGKLGGGAGYYGDYDGFTAYCPGSTCTTLANEARRMAGLAPVAPPVTRDDLATVDAGASVTLSVLANDSGGAGQPLDPASLDLDPGAPGVQATRAVKEGTFTAAGGQVTFTSNGLESALPVQAAYTVRDSGGETSARASLSVTVNGGSAGVPLRLYSFEDGPQGWAPTTWNGDIGSVSQSAAFRSDGAASLQVSGRNGGGWYGVTPPAALDLSGKGRLKFELSAPGSGTSSAVALVAGSGYTWCQSGFTWVNAGTTVNVDVDLAALGCGDFDRTQVHSLYVYLQNGDFYLDNVRAE